MKKLLFLFLTATLWLGCSTKNSGNKILDEAFQVHKDLRAVQKEVIDQWKVMDTLSIGSPQLTEAIKSNRIKYDGWKYDLLEVPGYPHIHLEGDKHEHHHQEQINLPDEQILNVQREAKKVIEEIYTTNKALLEKNAN